MWPDNETCNDLLCFDVHAELLAGLMTNPRLLPLTIGLFGDWGGGKSSVMSMLRRRLEALDRVACLHFNGWTFEGYDDARAALMASILLQLGEHKRIGPRVRDRIVPLLKRVNYLRIATFLVRHGSTALQVSSGMAGPMIVRGTRPPTPSGHGDLDTLLKPIAGQPQQFRCGRQIPVGIGRVDMTKIG